MKFVLYILFLFFFSSAFANNKTCLCEEEYKESSFVFSNGRLVTVCSSSDDDHAKKEYEVRILDSKHDNVLDVIYSPEKFKIKMQKDTLLVFEYKLLASGKNRKPKVELWHIFKFYFIDSVLVEEVKINQRLRVYSKEEIKRTIVEYKDADSILNPAKIELASKLVMAGISGDTLSQYYINNFSKKYRLDSMYSLDFIVLKKTLNEWQNQEDTTFKILDSASLSYKLVHRQSVGISYGWFGCLYSDGFSSYKKISILQYNDDAQLVVQSEKHSRHRGCQGGIEYLKTTFYDTTGYTTVLIDGKNKINTKYFFAKNGELIKVINLRPSEARREGGIDWE